MSASPIEHLSQTRIVKKLLPDQPGGKKLKRRFGEQLICVRYRQDRAQNMRYTTVELLVDAAPLVKPRKTTPNRVHVHIGHTEQTLRQIVRSHGGQWDISRQAWSLPKTIAQRLHLLDRVVS